MDIEPLRPVLDGADQLYIAVRTKSGPHVTPELFTVSGNRLVCLAAASTLKVRCARREPVVGIAGLSASGVFAAVAHVDVLDAADPIGALESPLAAASSPVDVARFVRDNAAELTGAALDALSGRLGLLPDRRVALVLTVDAAVVDAGGGVWSDGWSSLASTSGDDRDDECVSSGARPDGDLDLDGVPSELQDLVTPTGVVLGWTRPDGSPLALPARWEGTGGVSVPRALFEATGAATASAGSVTFDGWTGFGPSGKHGLMLRGHGRATSEDDAIGVVLDVDRATYWDGIETSTSDVGRPR